MNRIARTSIAAVAISLFAGMAFAQTGSTNMPRVDQRQANQQQRIDQGVASGQLTPKEDARLENGQQHVQNMENKAKADGTVTKKERARLTRAENRQSRKIFRQKHDRQKVAASGS